jgi:hypothetical protein
LARQVCRRGRLGRAAQLLSLALGFLSAGGALGAIERPAATSTSDEESDKDFEIQVDVLDQGSSSRRTKHTALEELPLSRLTADQRQSARVVLDDLSLYRRLPVVRVDADPRVIKFFTDHPEAAVGIWRAMGITELTMTPQGDDTYKSDSGDGSIGLITVLHRDAKQLLIHCEGLFKSPVLTKPIKARALMHLQTESTVAAAGHHATTCKADIFVSFPSTTIETAARVISPVSNRIADRNFEETAMFLRMMHVAMTQQPGWVEEIARRMNGVTPQQREEMLDLMAKVYVDSRRQTAAGGPQTLTPEDLRLPIRRGPEVSTDNVPAATVVPVQAASLPVEASPR